jgi:hypothetical protein
MCPWLKNENISNNKTIPDPVFTHGHIHLPGIKKIIIPGNNLVTQPVLFFLHSIGPQISVVFHLIYTNPEPKANPIL